jgi:hypothetical protein
VLLGLGAARACEGACCRKIWNISSMGSKNPLGKMHWSIGNVGRSAVAPGSPARPRCCRVRVVTRAMRPVRPTSAKALAQQRAKNVCVIVSLKARASTIRGGTARSPALGLRAQNAVVPLCRRRTHACPRVGGTK